jgi:peptidoglycan/LPS O-acetylase OafA/YrhL
METERRNKWIGILIGACFIAAGFYIGLLVWVPGYALFFMSVLALVFLAGGLISGIYSADTLWSGVWSGLLSGIIGALFITAYLVGIAIYSALSFSDGESGGMLLVLGIGIFLGAGVLAAAGGGIGMVMKRALSGNAK